MGTRIFALIAALVFAMSARAALESITSQDAASGQDGFFGNGKVKIPLPESAQKGEKVLRQLGMGRQADELILTINRAAEAAMPEAKVLLVDAVRKMSLQDGRNWGW